MFTSGAGGGGRYSLLMGLLRTAATVLLGLAGGCASRPGAAIEARLSPSPPGWVSTLHRRHPLVGRIWDARGGRFVDEQALEAALAKADFVLLGETHDNPDHHLLQAKLLRAMVSAGRRPALAFEMLDAGQQAAVDAALARAPRSADAVAAAVDWARSGWPDFSLYRPVFAVGAEAGLPLVAASLPHDEIGHLITRGASALATGLRRLLERAGPLPEGVARAMRQEMRESHCGQLPESMLDTMVLVQRARDAQMAERLLSANGQGAVLIAGTGHVRADRGVPVHLRREAQGRTVLAVAFLEVSPEQRAPEAYAAEFGPGPLPFDDVVFTPAAEREDPCKGLQKRAESSLTYPSLGTQPSGLP